MKNKIRIGIIGAGWVARERHLPALKALPEVTVDAIWSRNEKNARQLASALDIPKVVAHWQEIVESPTVDAVIVATPPNLHHSITLSALQAGKHVLCQARLARNLKEASEMVSSAQRSGLVTAVYPARPGLKGDLVVKRLLHDEHYVGDVTDVRVVGLSKSDETDTYSWLTDPEVVGVNAMSLGMWAEVLNRWLGPAKRLTAIGTSHRKRQMNSRGQWEAPVVPDSLSVAGELACGATASYHFSTNAQFAPNQSIAIYGPRGAIQYDFFPDVLRGATGDDKELHPIDISSDEERTQDTDIQFVRAILDGTSVTPDFEEGLRYIEFCEAVALSLRTGDVVSLPLEQPAMQQWGERLACTADNSVAG
jgi:predicted dehydrogenase